MRGYFVKPSKVTPSVYFSFKNRLLDVRGRSNPENPLVIYSHLTDKIDTYFMSGAESINVNLAFEYFNTSSGKCLFVLLRKLQQNQQQGKKVVVNWYYEKNDPDMREVGEDFSTCFSYDFHFREVSCIN